MGVIIQASWVKDFENGSWIGEQSVIKTLKAIVTIFALSRNVYIVECPDSPEAIRRSPALLRGPPV